MAPAICPAAANTGDKVMLSVFTNRPGEGLRYAWLVTSAPSGASDTVGNPTGPSTCTFKAANGVDQPNYECEAESDAKRPIFVPQHPGQYTLTVSADLQAPSTVEPLVMHAGATVTITVEGDDVSNNGGCQFAQGRAGAGMLFVGLGLGLSLLLRRRRRR